MKSVNLNFLARGFVEIGIFSVAANLLLLVTPIYLLQVYDRVLTSSSLETLGYISLLAVAGIAVLGLMEEIRTRYASRLASRLDIELGEAAFAASVSGARGATGDVLPLRDLASARALLTSRGFFALFDLPFVPVFMLILYVIHPVLLWVTLAGLALMLLVVIANQLAMRRVGRDAAEASHASLNTAQQFGRNFETVQALGMSGNVAERWGRIFGRAVTINDEAARTNSVYGGIARVVRMGQQIAILGIGAWLVLAGEMTGGMIFASSIISGRVLAPIDQIVGLWRQMAEGWVAAKRLVSLAGDYSAANAPRTALPDLSGLIDVQGLVYFAPGAKPNDQPLIKRLNFKIEAGESVAIVGPSRAGKSTLARLLVGAITPNSGAVRFDNSDLRNWDGDMLGRQIGYLSQEVDLFPGTIAENISRFSPDAGEERLFEAARLSGSEALIAAQPKAFDTEIGPSGVRLSGGERQRLGLARAFYGNPKIIILDEPNSSLDQEGEAALEKAIRDARDRKCTLVLITHKPSVAMQCTKVMVLKDGQIEQFGPAEEVMRNLSVPRRAPPVVQMPQSGPNVARGPGASFAPVIRATQTGSN